MFTYKAEIKSGPLLEVKYYKSFRKRNKKNLARQINQSRTNEKQVRANRIRGEQHTQRLILCNFSEGDWFARFSAPFGKFTEDEFERVVSNFFKRVKRRTDKKQIKFKYIGYCECGKLGKNWHLHIVIENCVREILMECWPWKNGINFTPLYQDGNYADLAKYIRKDVNGKKRLKTSRNLAKPDVKVIEGKKREYRKLERGEALPCPEGYYFYKDEMWINDYTGASFYFTYLADTHKHKKFGGAKI
jgi:hypothetical protein|nr:MAG TPA: replication protein A [Caudoviricetes sp.]